MSSALALAALGVWGAVPFRIQDVSHARPALTVLRPGMWYPLSFRVSRTLALTLQGIWTAMPFKLQGSKLSYRGSRMLSSEVSFRQGVVLNLFCSKKSGVRRKILRSFTLRKFVELKTAGEVVGTTQGSF